MAHILYILYTICVMPLHRCSCEIGILFSYAFTIVGLVQMGDWALKKHKEYKKTYDKEYTSLRRKAMIPFVF